MTSESLEYYLFHRISVSACQSASPDVVLNRHLELGALALASGFDGLALPGWVDLSDTVCADPFALMARLTAIAPNGRFAITDLSPAIHGVLGLQRHAVAAAALAQGRVELGLSVGRPRDIWAANVSAAEARISFKENLRDLLWALGVVEGNDGRGAAPAFRSLRPWPSILASPKVFISGTYCAENRDAIVDGALPWLSYGDLTDTELAAHAGKGLAMVMKVDLIDTDAELVETAPAITGDPRLFSARGAPLAYYSTQEFRRRLNARGPECHSGAVEAVAAVVRAAAKAANARRIIIDPCRDGMSSEATAANVGVIIAELLPAMRAITGN